MNLPALMAARCSLATVADLLMPTLAADPAFDLVLAFDVVPGFDVAVEGAVFDFFGFVGTALSSLVLDKRNGWVVWCLVCSGASDTVHFRFRGMQSAFTVFAGAAWKMGDSESKGPSLTILAVS